MVIQTVIDDENMLENLEALFFSVEIGELHERDKFKWAERINFDGPLRKKQEFGFKMNHIKQVVSILLPVIMSDKSPDPRQLLHQEGFLTRS